MYFECYAIMHSCNDQSFKTKFVNTGKKETIGIIFKIKCHKFSKTKSLLMITFVVFIMSVLLYVFFGEFRVPSIFTFDSFWVLVN